MAEGSVYRRGSDGRWVAEFRDAQGRTRYRYRPTRAAARQALREELRARDEGASGDDPTLAAWSAWWLDHLDRRPTTVADYRYRLSLLPRWLPPKRLRSITPMDVHEALLEIAAAKTAHGAPRASSTVASVRTVLAACLRAAERYGHVSRNAAALAAPIPVTTPEVVPLDLDEASRLLAAVRDHRLGSLYRNALSLGMRESECIGLRWSAVDLEAGTIDVVSQLTRTNSGAVVEGDPKTKRSVRRLLLPPSGAEDLRRHRTAQMRERLASATWVDEDLVWPSNRGTPLGHRNLLRHLHGACATAGIRRVSFHTLRHSAATLLSAQGVPDHVIMDVLGHADLRTLGRYRHVTDSMRQVAADAMEPLYRTRDADA